MASSRALEKPTEEEETEVDDLNSEVNEMARKIMEYRSSLPERVKSRFATLVEAQRPVFKLPGSVADPGPSGVVVDKDGARSNSEAERDTETAEKVRLLKQKMSSNASAMPIVLKRMNECIARIDILGSCNFTINPVFKRKRSD